MANWNTTFVDLYTPGPKVGTPPSDTYSGYIQTPGQPTQVPCTEWRLQYRFQPNASERLTPASASFQFYNSSGGLICSFFWSASFLNISDPYGSIQDLNWQVIDFQPPFTASVAVGVGKPWPAPGVLGLVNSTSPLGADPAFPFIPNNNPLPTPGNVIMDGYMMYGPALQDGSQPIIGFGTPIIGIPLPAGSYIVVGPGPANYTSVLNIESIQLETKPGGGGIVSGFRHSQDGEALLINPGAPATQFRSVDRTRALGAASALSWGTDGQAFLLRRPGGTQTVALFDMDGNIMMSASSDDGLTYGVAMQIYTGYTLLGAIRRGDGFVVLMSGSGGAYVGYGDRSGFAATPVACTIPPSATTLAPGQMIGGTGNQIDFFWADSSGNTNHLGSTDDGITWQ